MSDKKEPRQSRSSTHFKFFSEKYLWGSTRSELLPDERAVWVDFLSLASLNFGEVEIYSRDQTAQQLLIQRELLDRSIDKFIKSGKIKRRYYKREKKEIFTIVKWSHYQADYLKKRDEKSTTYAKNKRSENKENTDAENQPILEERKGEEIKAEEIKSEENKGDDSSNGKPLTSINSENSFPLPSDSNSLTEGHLTKKDQFLLMLKNCYGYLFNEYEDSLLFDISIKDFPKINIIKQTEKKISWWKNNPEALKADPRKKLYDWFKEEYKFKRRGGPQQIGEILKELDDPDQRNWAKKLAGIMEQK